MTKSERKNYDLRMLLHKSGKGGPGVPQAKDITSSIRKNLGSIVQPASSTLSIENGHPGLNDYAPASIKTLAGPQEPGGRTQIQNKIRLLLKSK